MPKPAPKKSTIPKINLNLLHPQGMSQKIPERFLKWLISYGRFIVVIVEVIVIGAFVMRFSLDAKLDDLKRKINEDVPYVMNLTSDEALIKQTQFRLTNIKTAFDSQDHWLKILEDLNSKLPTEITFLTLNLEGVPNSPSIQFRLSAQTASNTALSGYLNSLKSQNSKFKDVILASISYDENQISFTITGSTK